MSVEQAEECILSNPADQSENIVLAKFEALTPQNMCSSQSGEDPLGEQVLGYLEVQPSELGVDQNATIFLQPQEIEIDGQHLILTQEGEGGSEIIVVVSTDQDNPSEHTVAQLTQSAIVNSSAVSIHDVHRAHTLVMEGSHCASHVELIGSDLVGSSADAEESMNLSHACGDRTHISRLATESGDPHCSHMSENDSVEITSSSSSWNIPNCKLQDNDDSTEMLFIPTPSALSSGGSLANSVLLSSSDTSAKHRNLMHLACIAQELQSANSKNDDCDEPSGSDETHQNINSSVLENSADLKQQDQDISSSSYISAEASESSKTSQFDENLTAASNFVQLSSNDTSVADVHVANTSVSEDSPGSPDTSSEAVNQHLSVFHVTSSSADYKCSEATSELPELRPILNKPISDGSGSETCITSNSNGESSVCDGNEEVMVNETSSLRFTGESELPIKDFSDTCESLNISGKGKNDKFEGNHSQTELSSVCGDVDLPCVSSGLPHHQIESALSKTSSEASMSVNCLFNENFKTFDDEISGVIDMLPAAAEACDHTLIDKSEEVFVNEKKDTLVPKKHAVHPVTSTLKMDSFAANDVIEIVEKDMEEARRNKLDEYNFNEDNDEIEILPLSTKQSKHEPSKRSRRDSDIEVIEVFKCSNDENMNNKGSAIDLSLSESDVKEIPKNNPMIIRISAENELAELQSEFYQDKGMTDLPVGEVKLTQDETLKASTDELSAEESLDNLNKELAVLNESSTCHSFSENSASVEKVPTSSPDVEIIEVQIEPPKKTYTRQSKAKILLNKGEECVKKPDNGHIVEIELFSCDDLVESVDKDFNKEPTLNYDVCTKDSRKQNSNSRNSTVSALSDVRKSIPSIQKKRKAIDDTNKRSLRPRNVPQEEKIEPTSSNSNKRNADSVDLKQNDKKKPKTEDVNSENKVICLETAGSRASDENEKTVVNISEISESTLTANHDFLEYTSTPVKRGRYKSSKSKVNSNISWEKLIKSPPGKVKMSSFLSNIRKRKIKLAGTKDTKRAFSHSFCSPKRSKHSRNLTEPSLPLPVEIQPSLYAITPLKSIDVRIRCQSSLKVIDKSKTYQCGNCKFRTNRLANLIQHYKDRCLSEGSDIFEWGIHDMDRRQRIRGEEQNDYSISETAPNDSACENSKNLSSDDHDFSKRTEFYSDYCSEDDLSLEPEEATNKLGFKEDDIVWAEWKNIFWPALVRHIYPKEKRVSVFLVGSPTNKNGIKINVKKIRPFDNAEQNKKLLGEGAVYPDQEVFVKAVQKAEFFIRKKLLGVSLNSSQFFENLDDDSIAYVSDAESSTSSHSENCNVSSANENLNAHSSSSNVVLSTHDDSSEVTKVSSTADNRQENYDFVEITKFVEYIKENKVDDYLLGIFNNTVFSERHRKFNSSDLTERDKLKWESWFGPIVDERLQEDVSEHCLRLLKSNCEHSADFDAIAYAFEVWVPEAIIKSISCTRDVSLIEAEEFFTKDTKVNAVSDESNLNIPSTEGNQECKDRLLVRMKDASVSEEIAHALAI